MKLSFEVTEKRLLDIIETMLYLGYSKTPENLMVNSFTRYFDEVLSDNERNEIFEFIERREKSKVI